MKNKHIHFNLVYILWLLDPIPVLCMKKTTKHDIVRTFNNIYQLLRKILDKRKNILYINVHTGVHMLFPFRMNINKGL